MKVLDKVNTEYGKGKIVIAAQGIKPFQMNHAHLSQRYTTNWDELLGKNTIGCNDTHRTGKRNATADDRIVLPAGNRELCDECRNLLEYASKRLEHCCYGNQKSACKDCPTHCYTPAHREKIREVMRYAGPRMLLYHPVAALRHMFRAVTRSKKESVG